MKKFLFFLILLSFSIQGFAMTKKVIISFENQKVSLKNFGFRLIAVTDATSRKRYIGYVENKITQTPVVVLLANDVTEEFGTFIKQNLMPAPAKHDLIVRVNELTVYETHRDFAEMTIANVSLTFIFREDGHYFEKLTVSRHLSKTVSEGATRWLPEIIAKTIAKCFDEFYALAMTNHLDNVEMSENELKEQPFIYNERRDLYLSADRSEKGIYKTFFDFQQNTPDLQTDFDVMYKTKHTEDKKISIKYAHIFDHNTGKLIKNIWGFTDGKQIFTYDGTSFIPLFKDKKGYYLGIKAADDETIRASSLMGGLVGAVIASAAAPYQKVRLDIVTGRFVFENAPYFKTGAANEDEKVIKFFSSSYNSRNSQLYLIIDGEMQCVLKRESWYKYNVDNPGDTIRVTVVSENGFQTSKTIVKKPGPGDIYLLVDNKRKEPVLKEVYKQQLKGIESLMTSKNRVNKNAGVGGEMQ